MRYVIWSYVVVAGIVAAGCAPRTTEEPPFTLRQVGTHVWVAIDNPRSPAPAAANAGFIIGDESVMVIDTFWSADAARRLLAEIQQRTQLPIKYVVNTHYHLDHVAGNGVFAGIGAAILAHRNVRDWIHTENVRLIGEFMTPELKAAIDAAVAPAIDYDDGTNIYLGARTIQIRSYPGHTGGDSIVIIPDAKVAFLGDLFWRNMLPNVIDASSQPWIDTLNAIVATNESGWTFIPGHGDVGNAGDVAAFREYLVTLRSLVADATVQGKSGDALAEIVVPRLKEKYGGWEFAESLAKGSVLQTEAELRGTKRIPRPRSDR